MRELVEDSELAHAASREATGGEPRRSPRLRSPPPANAVTEIARGSSRATIQVNLFGRLERNGRNDDGGTTSTRRAGGEAPARADATDAEPAPEPAMPDLAHLERARKVKRKAPEGPRGRSKAGRVTKESCVPLLQRIQEFPDTGLKISGGKLFCAPCKEELPNLKEHIKRHLTSRKHAEKLKTMARVLQAEKEIGEDIADYFTAHTHEQGVRQP